MPRFIRRGEDAADSALALLHCLPKGMETRGKAATIDRHHEPHGVARFWRRSVVGFGNVGLDLLVEFAFLRRKRNETVFDLAGRHRRRKLPGFEISAQQFARMARDERADRRRSFDDRDRGAPFFRRKLPPRDRNWISQRLKHFPGLQSAQSGLPLRIRPREPLHTGLRSRGRGPKANRGFRL